MNQIKANLFDVFETTTARAFGHVCNCQGVMQSGIALQVKEKYPEVYVAYKEAEKLHKEVFQIRGLKLGTISSAKILNYDSKFGYNLHAQEFYGYGGKRYLSYEAIYTGLEFVRDDMSRRSLRTILFPFNMGCDRAGGDWNVVEAMIESVFKGTEINPTICKL
jgi:O-acetyl-ADP-ribose deacetylase (regulator of RNase III)